MGACAFNQTVVGVFKTPREAIDFAREEARDENGHQDGYSGDIQTCDTVKVVFDHPRYGTKKFWDWEEKKLEDLYKCEAIIIEIKGQELKRMKSRHWGRKRGVRAFYIFGQGRD